VRAVIEICGVRALVESSGRELWCESYGVRAVVWELWCESSVRELWCGSCGVRAVV